MADVKKRKPKPRRFFVTMTAHIELSQELLDAVLTDEWRRQFFDLQSPEEVAEHLAYNLAQHHELKLLDGFADKEGQARMIEFRAEGPGEETDE